MNDTARDLVRPDYDGRSVRGLVRALRAGADWIPEVARTADAVVLLVLDGLGWNQVQSRDLPNLGPLDGGPITSVVPSTTPTALTSISTGLTPAEHGVIGYRINIGPGVLNVLRWKLHGKGEAPDPEAFQPRDAFDGEPIPLVNRSEFRHSKVSAVQVRGVDVHGWSSTSTLVEQCRRLVAGGHRFVYAYYDTLDVIAHVYGMRDEYFEREIAFCDRLVGDLLDALPENVAVAVTADHGHVQYDRHVDFSALEQMIAVQSGESRFRYLHSKQGAEADLLDAITEEHSSHSWVFSRAQVIDERLLGPRAPSPEIARRIGDVVVAAREAVAFDDPRNPGESRLVSGHGSLTAGEMLVPLLAGRGRA
jgi:hypothetical protein